MTTGVLSASIAVVSSTVTGLFIDFVHKPAFGTITKSLMEFAVLGRVPGTQYFINFNNILIALALLLCLFAIYRLFQRIQKLYKTLLSRPHPTKIFGRLF